MVRLLVKLVNTEGENFKAFLELGNKASWDSFTLLMSNL